MNQKYVIFDLDETLGFFTELGIIWNCLTSHQAVTGQKCFDELCLLFEKEIFRPGIFSALNLLKINRKHVKVILYTNNNGGIEWLNHIISFMERRINARGLFSKIIPGYDPNLKEKDSRKTFDKTYSEIIRCADIPRDAKIIFFDDLIHPEMKHKNVTYIRVKPFCVPLKPSYVINKLQRSFFGFINYSNMIYLRNCIDKYHTYYAGHLLERTNNKVSNTDIFIPLIKFLNEKDKIPPIPCKTKKNKKSSKNKTKKNNA